MMEKGNSDQGETIGADRTNNPNPEQTKGYDEQAQKDARALYLDSLREEARRALQGMDEYLKSKKKNQK